MSTHTPGPWGLVTLPTSIGSCHQIGPFPSLGVHSETHACIYADKIRVGIDDCLPIAQELLANASLIAAAPDSYNACVSFIAAARRAWNIPKDASDEYIYDELGSDLSSAYFQARDAIAKATGEGNG